MEKSTDVTEKATGKEKMIGVEKVIDEENATKAGKNDRRRKKTTGVIRKKRAVSSGCFYTPNKQTRKRMSFHGKRKWCILLAMILLLVFVSGGCSGIRGNNSVVPQTEDTEKPTLSVWIFFDENTPGTYYIDLWKELAAKLGYQAEVKTYSTEQIKDKLKIALVCQELPDIFAVWGGSYPDFLFDAGACVPVEDYLEQADFKFKDSYVMPYRDGHNYIIPCLVEAYAVTYCNQNLMKEMNLTMPKTWEQLITLVEQVNQYNAEHGTDYAAIELGDKDSWLGELLYTVITNRIDPYAQDKLADGEIDFSDPVFGDAADKLLQLASMGAFPDNYLETGEVEAVQNFADGKAVLFPHQSTIMYHLMDEMGKDAFSMEQFPSCNPEYDDTYETYMVDINHTLTPGLCISSRTQYKDEAAELCLEFAQQVNEKNVTQYDYFDMIKDSGLQAPSDSPLPVVQFHQMLEDAQKYTPLWYAVLNKTDGDNWRNLTQKLLGGAVTKDEFIQTAPQYLNFLENE